MAAEGFAGACARAESTGEAASMAPAISAVRRSVMSFSGSGCGMGGFEPRGPGDRALARVAVEVQEDHRRDEERDHLREEQSADHGEAERLAQLRAGAQAGGDRD